MRFSAAKDDDVARLVLDGAPVEGARTVIVPVPQRTSTSLGASREFQWTGTSGWGGIRLITFHPLVPPCGSHIALNAATEPMARFTGHPYSG
jgi:hypothetical protein